MNNWEKKPVQRFLKRFADITTASLLLILFSPIMIATAIFVRLFLGSPVLFRQVRPGRDAKTFTLCKFRTMRDATDKQGNALPDDQRLTSLGKLLRKLSLDELPQLFNVIKGDMSLVGPRPLLVRYLERYSDRQARRHEMPPGITGWAQVNGRNAISWSQKFEYDVWYIENWSIWLDLKILFMTALKVVKRSDISVDGHATMQEFMGNDHEIENQ